MHDRWFARCFDRFLVFGSDGSVYESARLGRDRVARPPAPTVKASASKP
jgi:hypothetical protein